MRGIGNECRVMGERSSPANADSEGPLTPVPAFNDGHLAAHVASWAVEDLVRVAVVGAWSVVGVGCVGHCDCFVVSCKL